MAKTVILLTSEGLGGPGDPELRAQLIGSFLRKLWSLEKKPDTIIFYHSAVKLLIEGSSVLDALDGLSRAGVDLIACRTCIGYYDLSEKMKIGRISTMDEIALLLMTAEKVVTP